MFNIVRSVPQGDPLSALMFVLALEILLIKLRNYNVLKPDLTLANNVKVENLEAYADDLLTFLPANRESLSTLNNILTEYTKISGLELNQSKTEVMTIYDGDQTLLKEIVNMVGFSNAESIMHLGINFDNKLNDLQKTGQINMRK